MNQRQWARSVHGWALALALSLGCTGVAQAIGNDSVLLRAFTSGAHDSNVFRISDGLNPDIVPGIRSKSDLIWGLGAGLQCDIPVSRQRFLVDASATRYAYAENDQLDYTAYALRAAWDWRFGNDWSGRLGAGRREDRQTDSADVLFLIPSLLTTTDLQFDARYALTARWDLTGAYAAYRYRYDREILQGDNFDSDSLSIGAQYKTPLGNAVGVRLRYQQGEWPDRDDSPSFFFDDEYEQYTLSMILDWRPTGRSRVYGDLGYTWRNQEGVESRDFDGASGQITWDYTLSGKSQLRTNLYQMRGPIEDFTATYTRNTGVELTFFHRFSEKTSLQANAGYRLQDYAGNSVAPSADQRRDELSTVGASVAYQAMRKLTLNAGLRYDQRDSNVPFGDFDAHTVYLNANAQF